MKKKFVAIMMVAAMAASMAACGSDGGSSDTQKGGSSTSTSDVANKDKPLVWFNRQPSNSSTGELDMTALNYNKDTYYVGFDANQGAELQGEMVKEYIEKNIDTIDRNGDGVIGYVLAIGDIGHNDSIARTRGVRKALGTGVDKSGEIDSAPAGTNSDGKAAEVQDGKITVNGKDYVVRELASQEMKNSAGATWDAATAGNAIGTWSSSFGESIDVVVSNNDGMGMSMFNAWSKDNKVPTFGYDANSDAVAAIAEGYGGTISQHADVQAYLTLRVLRNALDGVDIDTGIGTEDDAGNVLSDDVYVYKDDERSYYALNVAVTADNYKDFTDSTVVWAPVSTQLDSAKHPTKKVWLNIYNASDNFLSSTYQPLLQKYDDLLNLDVEYIGGDGQTESNITNRLGNPSQYDAFAINMVKTDNAASYREKSLPKIKCIQTTANIELGAGSMGDKNNENILSIRGMSKSFGRNRVLDHINLDVKKGTVMGLMGENGAGKSTMMKCLFGTYQKDEGTIYLDGKEVSFSGPKDALENGIAMVHQELNQCLERNVVDNLFLGRYPVNSFGMIDEGRMKKEASELFRKLGMTVNLEQPMKNMSVSQRQMCEIAKAISYNSKVIVLDEPTSSLTVQEVEKLFQMMMMLRDQGISLIYISHKMDEIFEICDEISVLRDGNLVMTKSTKETNMNELIAAMVGRVLENRFPPVDNKPKDVILSIQHLSTKYEPHLQDITFDVHEGEIFGLYGLVGAGRTELLETIFGIRTRAAGRVYFKNQLMNFTCAKEAMDYGFALITEERKANGLFLKGNLTFNTTIANLGAYKNGPELSDSKMTKATSDEIKIMHTKCMGPEDMISALSGGNQQKVILGKWLERGPQIFMMDEPTRGIDVGAKYEIYELIINMAKQGKTVIVVSSEMPEILGITNRIGVMSNGRLSGIVNTKETNQEELLRLSAKYL